MLKRITSISSLLFAILLLTAGTQSDNGKAARTGAPGEVTCVDCHDDFSQGAGGGSIALSSTNMPGWEYVPGTTYHMTATVARTGTPLFGVGVEALTTSNANAGTLTITNSSTAIKSATISGVSRRNVVHTLNGGATPNAKAFAFDWVAPATNIGNVTFYFAGVAANGDGDEHVGDYVYVGNQVVSPAISTGISEANTDVDIKVYPNPVSNMLKLDYSLVDAGRVEIALFDLNGRAVKQLLSAKRQPGRHTEMIDGMDQLAAGTYVVRIDRAGTITTRPVVLQH
jgi:hypothetical protein